MKQQVVRNMTLMWVTGSGMPERVYAFGASLLLALPVVRHIMSWMGVVPANKQVMLDVLSKASGGALPEGIAGIFTGASRCISSFLMPSCWPLSAPCLVSPRCCLPRESPQVSKSFRRYSHHCCWVDSLLHHAYHPESVIVCKLHRGSLSVINADCMVT